MAFLSISPTSRVPDFDAQNLHAFLASCGADDIVAACRAVEAFLKEQPPEAALGFFRICFPLLLQKVFGYHDSASSSSSAWLVKATDERSTGALQSLLDPSGSLFMSMLALDREKAVQFVFPNERLPLRIRRLLLLDRGLTLLSHTCELFKSCMKVSSVGGMQLQLNLFEYYMFWFAYYASSCEDYGFSQGAMPSKDSRSRSFSHWVPGLHPASHNQNTKPKSSRHALYLQLLQSYLSQFVQSQHFVSLIHIPGTNCLSHGAFMLLTFVEFWLMKDDSWPLQASQLGAITTRFANSAVELDAVRLVVCHSNRLLKSCLIAQHVAVGGSRSHLYVKSPSPFSAAHYLSGACTNTQTSELLQRPLYGLISRAFDFWPAGIPVKQAWYVVNLWLDYMQPWNADMDEKLGATCDDSFNSCEKGFSAVWQGYVTRNYPFYSSLVVHFLDFATKYVSSNLESVLEMTAKVLGVLVASKDLLELLRKTDLSTCFPLGKRDYECVSSLDKDWEDNAFSSNNNLSDLLSPSYPFQDIQKYVLFSTAESGAFHTFQVLILQCEAEIQFVSPESQRAMSKSLEAVKHAGLEIFNPHSLSSSTLKMHAETLPMPLLQDDVPVFHRHTSFDVKYRGDWMRRPIESTEVAWLVRLLVKVSDMINDRLSLAAQVDHKDLRTSCHKLSDDTNGPSKFQELNVADILSSSKHSVRNLSLFDLGRGARLFLSMCWVTLNDELQRHGWRVNLRFLAQKPVVLFISIVSLWTLRKFWFCSL